MFRANYLEATTKWAHSPQVYVCKTTGHFSLRRVYIQHFA